MKADAQIKRLHKKFADTVEKLESYLAAHHGLKETDKRIFAILDLFSVNEQNGTIAIKGAILENGYCTLLGDIDMEICPLIFCEREYSGETFGIEGCTRIVDMVSALDDSALWSYEKITINNTPFFKFYPESGQYPICDEIGKPVQFSNIDYFIEGEVPENIAGRRFQVTINDDIKKTKKKDVFCIVQADKEWEDILEEKSIEVYRWFPMKRHPCNDSEVIHDRIYSFGKINESCEGFSELYDYLTDDETAYAFARTDENGLLHILGGHEQFAKGELSDYIYPKWFIDKF